MLSARAACLERAASTIRTLVVELDVVRTNRRDELSASETLALDGAHDLMAPIPPVFETLAEAVVPAATEPPAGARDDVNVVPLQAEALRARLTKAGEQLRASEARRFARRLPRATPAELRVIGDLADRGLTDEQVVHLFEGGQLLVPGHGLIDRWERLAGVRARTSSHYHEVGGPQFGLQGPLVHEVLFGAAPHTTTFVQLERAAPSRTRLPQHIADWVEYRITEHNEGPYGASPHTDRAPMRVGLVALLEGIAGRTAEVAEEVAAQPAVAILVLRDPPDPQVDLAAARAVDALRRASATLRSPSEPS